MSGLGLILAWELLQDELRIQIIFTQPRETILPLLSTKLPSWKNLQPTTVHYRKQGMLVPLLKPRNAPASGSSHPPPGPPTAWTATVRRYRTGAAEQGGRGRGLYSIHLREACCRPPDPKFQFLLLTWHVPSPALFFLLNTQQPLIYYVFHSFTVSNGCLDHQPLYAMCFTHSLYPMPALTVGI